MVSASHPLATRSAPAAVRRSSWPDPTWLPPMKPIFKAALVLGTYGMSYLALAKLARLEEIESLLAGVRRRLGT